jgi:hypothetical protein
MLPFTLNFGRSLPISVKEAHKENEIDINTLQLSVKNQLVLLRKVDKKK